jgi:hypothetical protein
MHAALDYKFTWAYDALDYCLSYDMEYSNRPIFSIVRGAVTFYSRNFGRSYGCG